ncbi:hypothetical protein HYPP_00938 [Hyphomicrobium sp. ghe19]|nr:hypothetical protein HYPP_00938 [Hyphomicrobium sp. ghe19]
MTRADRGSLATIEFVGFARNAPRFPVSELSAAALEKAVRF